MAYDLFLCGPCAKNGFYIFKVLLGDDDGDNDDEDDKKQQRLHVESTG